MDEIKSTKIFKLIKSFKKVERLGHVVLFFYVCLVSRLI